MLDYILKSFLGTMWVLILYVTCRSILKLFMLIRNQFKYNEVKEKWVKEVELYEDKSVIKETHLKYRKMLEKYEDRYELYD